MSCPDLTAWEEFASGRVASAQARRLEEHLQGCQDCRTVHEGVRRNARILEPLKAAWGREREVTLLPVIPAGMKIGRYEVTGILGSGGMATVYRAIQAQPHRTVALKMMKVGLGSGGAQRRFEHEAELLGRLQHPGIAHVYEAGVAEVHGHQQPYFAMELIEGEKLTDYARVHHLPTLQRLELLVRIGEAVHYAHQKGIIHRDLKPSNILVDKTGQPKILDFGVARATDADCHVTTMHTDVGQLIGTIPYMSPEQASGNPKELDLRSDVYSLGVVCYELLSGQLPYSLRGKTIPQAVRVIQEDDPTPLSSVNRSFHGDLATIVDKALEKDRERRYAAISAFVADIRRYLNQEPISARPPSAAYQISKFARRHRALVAGVTAVFVMLLMGLAGTGYGLVRATAERNRAVEAERAAQTGKEQAESVISLLKQMLSSADPEQVKGEHYTVRQLLDEYDEGLKGKSIGQPEVEATIRTTIGNAYLGLGLREQAERQLKASLELRRQAHGPEHLEVARALCDYAWYLRNNAEYPPAERTLREALEMQRRLLGSRHVEIATTLNRMADVLRFQEQYELAEQTAREALTMRRQLLGRTHPEIAQDLITLGWVLVDSNKKEEAKVILHEAISLLSSAYGGKHPLMAHSIFVLALVLGDQGDVAGAVAAYEEALCAAGDVLGEKHHDYGQILGAYGLYLATIGRYEEAEAPLVEALAIARSVHGDWHTCFASYQHQLARLYLWSGRASLAEPLFRQSVAIYAGILGEEHPWTPGIRCLLAEALIAMDQEDEALEHSRDAIVHYSMLYGETDTGTANAKRITGLALLKRGDAALAEPLLREAVDVFCETPGSSPWRGPNAQSALGECLVRLGRFEEAEPLLMEGYESLKPMKGEGFYDTIIARRRLEDLREALDKSRNGVGESTATVDPPIHAIP